MSDTEAPTLFDRLMAVKPDDLTRNAWAVRAGVSRSVWTDIRNRGAAERDTVEALLRIAGLEYDKWVAGQSRVGTEVSGTGVVGARDMRQTFYAEDMGRPLPVLGTAMGGEYADLDDEIELTELWFSQVIEYVARPASLRLDTQAYALTIVGDSMVPRFRPSERVAVSPQAPVAIGDDVIIQLRGPEGDGERIRMVLIKELVRRTARYYELRQYNPAATFRVPVERIAAVHKVTTNFF